MICKDQSKVDILRIGVKFFTKNEDIFLCPLIISKPTIIIYRVVGIRIKRKVRSKRENEKSRRDPQEFWAPDHS